MKDHVHAHINAKLAEWAVIASFSVISKGNLSKVSWFMLTLYIHEI